MVFYFTLKVPKIYLLDGIEAIWVYRKVIGIIYLTPSKQAGIIILQARIELE